MEPPPPLPNYQAFEDANHLRYLAIAHYIMGGIIAFFSCFFLIHVAMGGLMVAGSLPMGSPTPDTPDPRLFGWFFVVAGLGALVVGWAVAIALFLAGRWLSARKNYTFCLVVSCIQCLNVPLGTVLGVFTILVLNRPSVKALFVAGPTENNWTRE